MKCLAIDFGGTFTKYSLIDENADITDKNELPSPLVGVDGFLELIKRLYEKYKEDIEGVAISMPGIIDIDTGILIGSGAFEDLWGKNLYELIRSVIPVPFSLENDGKCGALAEVWKGSLSDVQDGVVVIIGTGDAGGIIKNRKIHRGYHNTAGEISFLMSRPGEYGTKNMLAMHAAMMGLTSKAAAAKGYGKSALESGMLQREDMIERIGISTKDDRQEKAEEYIVVDGHLVFRWLNEGDTEIVTIYNDFIAHIGMMLFNIQIIYDPEKIAVGGGVSRQERLFTDLQAELDKIQEPIKEFKLPEVKLVPCKYLGDANMVGAMYNYLQKHHPDLVD